MNYERGMRQQMAPPLSKDNDKEVVVTDNNKKIINYNIL